MTNRLVIIFPSSSITLESDNREKIITLSTFCKEELDAYHSTENVDELTVDSISEEMSDKFHSLVFRLGLI